MTADLICIITISQAAYKLWAIHTHHLSAAVWASNPYSSSGTGIPTLQGYSH